MLDIKKYLDYAGLQQFWDQVKAFYATDKTAVVDKAKVLNDNLVFKVTNTEGAILGQTRFNETTNKYEVYFRDDLLGKVDDVLVKHRDSDKFISQIDETDHKAYIDLTNYALKSDLVAVLKFMGVKDYEKDLPTATLDTVGHIYHVKYRGTEGTEPLNAEFVGIETTVAGAKTYKWEQMGSIIDLSNYYTKSETDTAISTAVAAEATARDAAITAAIEALDSEVTQTAGTDGLALKVTEVNGLLTAVEGSIAPGTYDAGGAAAQALTDAKAYTDGKTSTIASDLTAEIAARKAGDKEVYDAIQSIEDFNIRKLFKNVNVASGAELKVALADAATNGGVVTLTQDITLTNGNEVNEIPADKDVWIDLNGHTLTAPHGVRAFNVRVGAKVKFVNGAMITEYDHSIDPQWASYAPLMVIYGPASTETTDKRTTAIFEKVYLKATHLDGGTLIQTNGSHKNVDITFNEVKMEGMNYLPARGSITVNGGDFYMKNGPVFSVKNGCPFTVNGGKYVIDVDNTYDGKWGHMENGTFDSSAAILVECCDYGLQGNPEVHFNGADIQINNTSAYEFFKLLVIEYNGQTLATTSEMKADYSKSALVGNFTTDGETEPVDGWVYFSRNGVENKGKVVDITVPAV